MEEDLQASEGFDLLGLALGRTPGGSDLDECVDLEIYYDGTQQASVNGEALPFLRARLCEFFEVVGADLDGYCWDRDRFLLEVQLGEDPEREEPHLSGHIRTGDGAEDEWFVVHLLRQYTAKRSDVACRVIDSDGELLLIETALAAPRWLDPANAEHRCWLRGGKMHILPRPRAPEPERILCRDALVRLRAAGEKTVAKEKVQCALDSRLAGYPRRACELSKHIARAVLPKAVARALLAYPQLVAVALDHLPPAPSSELTRLRQQLPETEAQVRLDCDGLSQNDVVCVGVRFTRCQYARLVGLHCQMPQRFTLKHWKTPLGAPIDEKAMRLGQMLCAGLETAFLQDTQAATAALQWPSPRMAMDLLPPQAPWWFDKAFACQAKQLTPPLQPNSVSSRRAFLQQAELDDSFQTKLMQVLSSSTLVQAVDLAAHWHDRDDGEEWLLVSAEEIDREMMARQAEFDAYDKRRQRDGADRAPEDNNSATAENIQQEVASLGQEISSLLERASGTDGVDVAEARASTSRQNMEMNGGSDSDSDHSSDDREGGEIDVLGMEDEGDDDDDDEDGFNEDEEVGGEGHFRSYMSELDEQLGGALDDHITSGEDEGASNPKHRNGLPLHSHHVKVHGTEPIELDMHAMEHLLQSFCAEHQLQPGPASLLLGELGLAKSATENRRRGNGYVGESGSVTSASALNSMD